MEQQPQSLHIEGADVKVTGITRPTPATDEAFERAVARVAAVTAEVLRDLPPRRQPPTTVPPLRRPQVRAREQGRAGG